MLINGAIFGRRCGPPHDWAPGAGADTPLLIIINELIIHPLVGKNVWSWIAVSLSHDQRLTGTRCGLHIVRTRAQTQPSFRNTLGVIIIIKRYYTTKAQLAQARAADYTQYARERKPNLRLETASWVLIIIKRDPYGRVVLTLSLIHI